VTRMIDVGLRDFTGRFSYGSRHPASALDFPVRNPRGGSLVARLSSVAGTANRLDSGESSYGRRDSFNLVPRPVTVFRISMTYHDVGCVKLAWKTVD